MGLSLSTLDTVPRESRPPALPGDLTPGIVHIGLGAFHRAHQAVYTQAAGGWGIVGVAPRSRDVLDRLRAQDGLYSVVTVDGDGSRADVIGVHCGLLHGGSDPDAVVAAIADPRTRVVTLTVTEKGYRLDAAGNLTVDEGLRAELTGAAPPLSTPGALVRGLLAREAAGAGPLAVLCSDNMRGNGARLRGMVTQALGVAGRGVPAGISFPSAMVDRIVPATTSRTLDLAHTALGVPDAAPVTAEPFMQWVIEDDFPGGRPRWERAGAILTDDVAPWESMKLRVLLGVHSGLAYLGALAGVETIDRALSLPGMVDLMERLIRDDIAPTVTPPPGVTVVGYGAQALHRFANPALGHRTLQVAMDGTQKLPYRLVETIVDGRRAGLPMELAALVLAAWMRFTRGTADDGSPLPLNDPLADRLRGGSTVDELLAIEEVFPPVLREDREYVARVEHWLGALESGGAADTVKAGHG
ncbi:mannitol dehydrogenase [Virgisporangium aliadipatigenens]|uniref:Mannitol-1-phosphate 5-dehydrogenase n=1 Tax=Virgisporangium aliadipatigenens TaxID=741659 RepID=A0A8J3YJH0_9ACTN|nr:mannitol dehydrogenase family protein [Virgisporangium aliadipatigenens]GIJ46544.1 mannitol dehydrogenase [Virgisporangium aliadipatigenens]